MSGYAWILFLESPVISGYYIQCVRIWPDTIFRESGYFRILYTVCQDMSGYYKQDVSVNTKVLHTYIRTYVHTVHVATLTTSHNQQHNWVGIYIICMCVHNSDRTFVNGIPWVRICQDISGYYRQFVGIC